MKILWVCNTILSSFAKRHGLDTTASGGWIDGSFERICREIDLRGERPERLIELGVCFPLPSRFKNLREQREEAVYYGFSENLGAPEVYDPEMEVRFKEIISDFDPDIVHIFGTEFPHTLAMVRAFGKPEKTLIGIQGLCGEIADVYMAELPYVVQHAKTFRDRYRRDSLLDQKAKFDKRAAMEEEAIRGCLHLTGRTMFDRRACGRINPEAVYHPMNETLRACFYHGSWQADKAEPYSIFISQANYPIKGFHFMLQAMPYILEKFPNTHLYVAGQSLIGGVSGERGRYPLPIRITAYGLYLKRLIRQRGLEGHVTMLGKLSAQEMNDRYLKSAVFVCPSMLENSPNAVCEAMLLGLPVVAAKVGGIPDFISDGEDGILFPQARPQELAEGVKALFYDPELGTLLGRNARRKALRTHNPDTNYNRLLGIYRSMMAK